MKNDSNILSPTELSYHIKSCTHNNRKSQKQIYTSFYGYAMAICKNYTNSNEDATEIINDGFLKIFMHITEFEPYHADVLTSFKGWLSKIMMRTAIDHYRRNRKQHRVIGLDQVGQDHISINEDVTDDLSIKEVAQAAESLSPAYRPVFNLFVFEGLKHFEIADTLDISVGTSKSNLSKARKQLQSILFKQRNDILRIPRSSNT